MEQAIFVRHGESEYNRLGHIGADPATASSLTARGRRQAKELARLLQAEPIDLCVTSEIPRAIETAEVVLVGRRVPRVELGALNDPRAGTFEGGPVSTYVDWLSEHGRQAPNPGGGESQLGALRRYLSAFNWIVDRPERAILVVSHALPMAWIRAVLEGSRQSVEVDFENPGISFASDPLRLARARLQNVISTLGSVTGLD